MWPVTGVSFLYNYFNINIILLQQSHLKNAEGFYQKMSWFNLINTFNYILLDLFQNYCCTWMSHDIIAFGVNHGETAHTIKKNTTTLLNKIK